MVPRTPPPPAMELGRVPEAILQAVERPAPGEIVRESVSPIYRPAGRDFALDGRDSSRRIRGVHAAARLGVARSGLPHDSGGDVLSGGQSRRGGVRSDGATRTAVWPSSRPQPDDLHQLGRKLCNRAAVFARAK